MSIEPITPGEILPEATLEDCERVFRQGDHMERQGALQQGMALMHIRDNDLYKQTHSTFEAYVEDRLRIVRTRGYHLISLAKTVQELSTTVDTPAITHERQARAIRPVLRDHGPEVAAEVLREAATEGKVTARSITEAAERVIKPTIVEVETEPVDILTVDEWKSRNGYDDPIDDFDTDAMVPDAMHFRRKFWGHIKQTHALLLDMDHPEYFDPDMAQFLSDFVRTLADRHNDFEKNRRGLRVVQGGSR